MHISSGTSALTLACLLGERKHRAESFPSNLPFVILGGGVGVWGVRVYIYIYMRMYSLTKAVLTVTIMLLFDIYIYRYSRHKTFSPILLESRRPLHHRLGPRLCDNTCSGTLRAVGLSTQVFFGELVSTMFDELDAVTSERHGKP